MGLNGISASILASQVTGLATSATTDTTNASNISTGTLSPARMAVFTTSANGLAPSSGGGTTNYLRADGTWDAPSGSGSVSNFSAGTLSPLFTTSVATSTTTPALSFALTNAAANTVFGNFTGSSAAPTFTAAPTFSAANLTSFPTFNQNTTGSAASLSATLVVGSGGTGTGSAPSTNQILVAASSSAYAPVTMAGDATIVAAGTITVKGLNGTLLSGLATGLLKNTTATGVPSIASPGTDYVVPSGSITGNATTATNIANGTVGQIPYQTASNTTAFVSANTAATDQVLISHGTGSVGLAPTLSNAPALSAANMTSFPTFNQNTTGTAAIATAVTVTGSVSTNASYYPTFVAANSSTNQGENTSALLSFNPSSGVLSATSFTGAGTGLTGTAASLSIGGNAATATSATTAGSATSATTATNATNIATTGGSSSGSTFYPTFVSSNTSGNYGATTTGGLNFVPSTGTLTTPVFDGSSINLINGTVNITSSGLIAAPQPSGTPSGSGGSIPAGATYAFVLGVDAAGYLFGGGNENFGVTTSGTTSSIAWSWTAMTGAVSYRLYVGNSGSEANYFTSTTNSFTQTLPSTSGTAGVSPFINLSGIYLNGSAIYGGLYINGGITLAGLSTPSTATGTPSGTGGTVAAAASNYCIIVAVDASGFVSLPSFAATPVTTSGSTSSISWTWSNQGSAASWRIYVGSSYANYFTCAGSNAANTITFVQTLPVGSGVPGGLPTVATSGTFSGAGTSLTGTASNLTAGHVTVNTTSSGSNVYPLFSGSSGGGSITPVVPSTMFFVPSTGVLTTNSFVGTIAGSASTITYSTTPTLSAVVNTNVITLTGNVTSSTLAAGTNGQDMTIMIIQDATGGHTWTWPSNVRGGGTIDTTLSTYSIQSFIYITALSQWCSYAVMQTGL